MQEDFLHYIWKFKKFDFGNAQTVSSLPVVILDSGIHNFNSGPDFFNSRIRIGEQLWAGNVEIHLRSSDWYLHNHEIDAAYDNVILHVVWEHDLEVFRNDNSVIPTLELRNLVLENCLENYRKLLLVTPKKWINCENDFPHFNDFDLDNWLERLYLERLQEKSHLIFDMLEKSGNNWEEVLFKMIAKNFGLNVNGSAFLSMAQSFDFKIMQKCGSSNFKLEALFFGQIGLLQNDTEDSYLQQLQKEYMFLRNKYKLQNTHVEAAKYFRLRPDNFPSIRLSQLASLYCKIPKLFSEIISLKTPALIYKILEVETSKYWKSHYSFGKRHSERSKKLSRSFIDLLIINTIAPLQFCYLQKTGRGDVSEILNLMEEISAEKNTIIEAFDKLRPNTAGSSLKSQALLHLKHEYCDKNACLSCNLGSKLLQGTI
ncbi:DUF2851 family protein [Gillisia sp. M10.2A]|uniref:DUF2851 family protein n=1 Tax=Gillisia lutea TaxID=2909668 RepID=A0ABS9EGR6_9FLAO|nr:DUF2851 family protein [Gillisia lutea]MCF4100965.1 DUF2851 family protein [Gillisia lutea]